MATRRKRPSLSAKPSTVSDESTPSTAVEAQVAKQTHISESSSRPWNKIAMIIALAILILAGIVYLLKDQLFVASVNGQLISRLDLMKKLEERSGKETLDSVVAQILIQQEARKRGITISKEEVDAEIKKIEDRLSGQGQKLEDALLAEGYTRSRLEEEIRVRKSLEKLVADKTEVTDAEVDAFIKENAEFLSKDADPAKAREEALEQLKNEKISSSAAGFLEELKANAKINYLLKL